MDASADSTLAAKLAMEAGLMLLDVRDEYRDAGESDRRNAGDRCSQAFLASELARYRPSDAVLSEEGVDNPVRLTAPRVWIVDPLDGTREFAEPGREDWAVHVALWQEGRLVAGAVALPARRVMLSTPDVALAMRATGRPRIVVSRTRPQSLVLRICDQLDGDLVRMGSAGAKVASIVEGFNDVYVHAGGQHEWDSAAPVAVATTAGLHASRLDGSQLAYNQPDAWLPDLVVCRPELADRVLAAAAQSGDSGP